MAEKCQKQRDWEGMCHGGESYRLGSSGDGALAERVGFEPTVRITAQRLSSSKILMLACAVL